MAKTDDDIARRAEAAVGKVLRDKWRLVQLLGVGGMASVYAAAHRNGQRAAIKILHPEAALAPTVKGRFLHEGYLANAVEHSGAVSILDDDVDEDGTVYLVMELLRGETLETRLDRKGGDIPPDELLQIIDQVLDCLIAAHDKGIVHRDIKPGNLFITEHGRVKILDFGIARLEAGKAPSGHNTGGQALGTPGFMPTEQARGHWDEVDAKSDLWAVGATMFAVLTGRPVHEGRTVNEQLLSAMTEPAPPVRQVNPVVAEAVAHIVDRALEFDKRHRWPNASEMRAAVKAAYHVLTGKRISEAPALIAQQPPPISVDPTVATLDGDALAPQGLQATTARPVAGGGALRAPSTALKVGAAVVTAAALAAAFVLLSKAPRPDHAPKGSPESAAARLPRLEAPAVRDRSPELPPAASASTASSVATTAEAVHPVRSQRRAARSPAAPAAAVPSTPASAAPGNPPQAVPANKPAPNEDVDIFTRRK